MFLLLYWCLYLLVFRLDLICCVALGALMFEFLVFGVGVLGLLCGLVWWFDYVLFCLVLLFGLV